MATEALQLSSINSFPGFPGGFNWSHRAFALSSRFPYRTLQRFLCCASADAALPRSPDAWNAGIPLDPDKVCAKKTLAEKKKKKIAGIDQDQLVDPWLLADPDSRFAEFHGVQIHYKLAQPVDEAEGHEEKQSRPHASVSIPAILLHGFGASLFSWERVMKHLAQILGAKVVAFDRPAFGLTSRVRIPLANPSNGVLPTHSNPYTIGFSAAATIAFIDFLQSNKAILIGHSAGCLVAVDAYLKAPERVAAIVMVAPAVMAPLLLPSKAQVSNEQEQKKHQYLKQARQILLNFWNIIVHISMKLVQIVGIIGTFMKRLWLGVMVAVLRSFLGRWLVKEVMDKLSLLAVRTAWYDRERVDEYVLSGYTKPLRCRDWEYALIEYVVALFGDPTNETAGTPLIESLGKIQCPVLIMTGDSDAIVPAWNAKRLAKVIPRAQFCVMEKCGHLPHEEKPEEFLSIVQNFMEWVQQGAVVEMPSNDAVIFMPA